jgi:hypothetical protein
MTQISCVYSRTATGRLALIFAADLWSKLHGGESATSNGAKQTAQVGAEVGPAHDQPLHVYLRSDPDGAALIDAERSRHPDEHRSQPGSHDDVVRKTKLAPGSIVHR